jgi:molybdopterin-containing oxidoreductase family membrane subunit
MSLLIGYAYGIEFFVAWYSGNMFERDTFLDRAIGQYAPFTWTMLTCNVVIPLLLFSKRIRTHMGALLGIAIAALIGIWLERYVIVVSSLSRGFDPATWGEMYRPTWVEASLTAASFAGFFLLFLLFVKIFPCISISELKEGAAHHEDPDATSAFPEPV